MFRLFAFFRLKAAQPQPQPGLVLAIERHQSATENYLDGACTFTVIAAYVASLLANVFSLGIACAIAVLVTTIFITVQMVGLGFVLAPLVRRMTRSEDEPGIVLNSAVSTMTTVACATLLCVGTSPLRHIGTAYLILVAANAAAALIVLVMQHSIAELERRYGVES